LSITPSDRLIFPDPTPDHLDQRNERIEVDQSLGKDIHNLFQMRIYRPAQVYLPTDTHTDMRIFILPALAILFAKVCIAESDQPVVISFLKPDGKTDDFTDTFNYDGKQDPQVESPDKEDDISVTSVSNQTIRPSDLSHGSQQTRIHRM
jgi:hypothetical protein